MHLYLRLNGYFVSGYIVHAPHGATTELDVLAVRLRKRNCSGRKILRPALPVDIQTCAGGNGFLAAGVASRAISGVNFPQPRFLHDLSWRAIAAAGGNG